MIDPNKFLEKFDKLPEALKDLVSSSKLPQKVEDILKLTNTDLKYYEPIMECVEEILLLEKDRDSLEKNIEEKTDLPLSQIKIIADLIKSQIFQPVNEALTAFSSPQKILEKLETNLKEKTEQKEKEIEKSIENQPNFLTAKETPLNTLDRQTKDTEIKNTNQATGQAPKIEPSAIFVEKEKESSKTEPQIKEETPLTKKVPEEKPLEEIKKTIPRIPEPQEITIEKPLDKTKELKEVKLPEISKEEQEKIKEKLLKVMTQKKPQASSQLLEKMKEISQTGVQPNNQHKENTSSSSYPKVTYFEKKKEPASLTTESSNQFIPEEDLAPKKEKEEIPDILKARVKEFKKKKSIL
ncbi:MAG: hypothetical protein AB7D02_00985 [Candidatus Paceibacterota bacterium]